MDGRVAECWKCDCVVDERGLRTRRFFGDRRGADGAGAQRVVGCSLVQVEESHRSHRLKGKSNGLLDQVSRCRGGPPRLIHDGDEGRADEARRAAREGSPSVPRPSAPAGRGPRQDFALGSAPQRAHEHAAVLLAESAPGRGSDPVAPFRLLRDNRRRLCPDGRTNTRTRARFTGRLSFFSRCGWSPARLGR